MGERELRGVVRWGEREDDVPIALVNISMHAWRDYSCFLTEFYSHGSVICYFFLAFLRRVYRETFTGPFMFDKMPLKAF